MKNYNLQKSIYTKVSPLLIVSKYNLQPEFSMKKKEETCKKDKKREDIKKQERISSTNA